MSVLVIRYYLIITKRQLPHHSFNMKAFLTTLVFSIILSTQSEAQFTFGPRLGLNMSTLRFTNNDYNTGYLAGAHAGMFGNYQVSGNLSLQLEAIYSMEGGSEELPSFNASGRIRNGFLQVPLLLQYGITPAIFIEAGVQPGFLLSAREKFEDDEEQDIKPFYKDNDFRIPLGAGYHFGGPLHGLSADIRYHFSLNRINKVPVSGGDLKNQVIALGFRFTL